jgi:hypothetical protein
MKIRLIDTGPFVAYLNRRDPAHQSISTVIDGFKGQLATTSTVVGEVMYFVSEFASGPKAFVKLLLASRIQIADFTQPRQLAVAVELMAKYSGIPMDFADATLVLLAEELGISEIVTLDRRGFSTYRTSTGRAFRLFV